MFLKCVSVSPTAITETFTEQQYYEIVKDYSLNQYIVIDNYNEKTLVPLIGSVWRFAWISEDDYIRTLDNQCKIEA